MEKKIKYPKKIHKVINKIPIKVLCNYNEKENDIIIEIQKNYDNLNEGDLYICPIKLLEEVNINLYNNLLD